MTEVDARGLSCPIPVVETKKALKSHPEGVCVLVDAKVCVENVSRFAAAMGYNAKATEANGEWKIEISR